MSPKKGGEEHSRKDVTIYAPPAVALFAKPLPPGTPLDTTSLVNQTITAEARKQANSVAANTAAHLALCMIQGLLEGGSRLFVNHELRSVKIPRHLSDQVEGLTLSMTETEDRALLCRIREPHNSNQLVIVKEGA